VVIEGGAPMEAIYIPQLIKAPEQTERIQINEYLPGLETLTPIQGELKVTHRGSYLEVRAWAETIVTLTCDRCLNQYNHRLRIKPLEMIWLEEPVGEGDLPLEREIPFEDFVETLPPNGHFRPAEWLYEQLCLEIPHRQLCDRACNGIVPDTTETPTDRRWSSLESLKSHLN
jgi:uncharacterized protein